MYGPASEPMTRFRSLCQRVFSNTASFVLVGFRRYPRFTAAQLAALANRLKEARTATTDADILKRIAYEEKALEYIRLFSDAIVQCHAFHKDASGKGADAARAKVNAVTRFLTKHVRLEIASYYNIRHTASLLKGIQRRATEMNRLASISRKHTIVAEAPRTWQFRLDPNNTGVRDTWFAPGLDEQAWRPIRIAEFWEKQGYPYDGYGWYRLKYKVPAAPKGKRLFLEFLAVDERAWVYVDGRYVGGHHKGDVGRLWQEPFRVEVTNTLKPGQTHLIAVRVHDSGGGGGIWKKVLVLAEK